MAGPAVAGDGDDLALLHLVKEARELVSIMPKLFYAPLFVLDRRERFGGDFCRLAPRAVLP